MKRSMSEHSGAAVYRRLLGYMKPYRPAFLCGIFGMVMYSIAEMQMAAIIRVIIDDVFIAQDEDTIFQILRTLLLIVIARSGGMFIAEYFMAKAGRGIIKDLRMAMFKKLMAMPTAAYDRSSSGELIAVFSYNVEQVAEATTTVVTTMIRDTVLVIALVGYMFYLNFMLATVFFVAGPLAALIVLLVSSRFRKLSRRIQQSIGMVTHITNEAIDGNQVVKIFGGEHRELKSFAKANDHNYRQNLKLTLSRIMSNSLIQFIAASMLIGIIYLATSGLIGEITAGMFSSYIVAMTRLFPPLKHLTNINAQLQKGIAAAQSIFALLDMPAEKDTGTLKVERAKGELEYRNVTFAYDENKGKVLNSVSFTVKPGETVALVGRSGSGKSTIAKLLPRFYEASQGEILLDGHPIGDYKLKNLRDQISFVSQHVTLFNDTIANNIAYGRLSKVSREDIVEAARAANALDFIEKLPEGLDTFVGEDGVLLSGGQRQRLAIARAILKDAPILILDEATSALDSESEKYIQAALDRLVENRTTIVIAHRLSTVEKANKIIVLDHGEIVEQGGHKTLLNKHGHYASLHQLQFNVGSGVEPEQQDIVVLPADPENYPSVQHNFLAQGMTSAWELIWYGHHPFAQLLAPIGYVFHVLVLLRRFLYRAKLLKSCKFPIPVIVVGNITVGGTGKTPLVIWLAEYLRKKGYRPGIISRGYKGKSKQWPLPVDGDLDPDMAGDEAVMIARRTGCPMVIGPSRCRNIKFLLDSNSCDVIISDDGLQHYSMARDIEIVVADGARGFGNGMMLPAGPMREPKSRLNDVDFIVTNGSNLPESYGMFVQGKMLANLFDDRENRPLKDLKGHRVHAVAAIGNPERFFQLLRQVGLEVIEHRFPDHHRFRMGDIRFANPEVPVIMTEKDAVKCRKFSGQLDGAQYWYLPVAAQLPKAFAKALDQRIELLLNEEKTV